MAQKRGNMKNRTMMQYFEWYLPKNRLHWKRCEVQAEELSKAGINMVWLPPAYKGAAGDASVGYDVYDTYDLGEFNQKGTVETKYGSKEEYLRAVAAFQKHGIAVLADIVLNHKMGADSTENVEVVEECATDRNKDISEKQQIAAWTRFDFPGRGDKYSAFHWNASHFSGTDWDDAGKKGGIFRFEGKIWNRDTDTENGNYDYLMGADLDMDNREVVEELINWGKWYFDTVHMDGFRLDAVKHISFDFYLEWLKRMREHTHTELFTVGEYWSKETERLTHYLDATEHSLSLFDVPLHFHFLTAATSDGNYDMSKIFEDTLTGVDPEHAVTFVDNHDTQPGQALYSFIPAWFKPIAYALILLRNVGVPCVFYGDYYGIPHDGVAPVRELKTLLKIRECYAYGEEKLYLDDTSLIGFTRLGDEEHPGSGIAVLCTDSISGTKKMYVGERFAGKKMIDAMNGVEAPVVIGKDGFGEFCVNGGSVSVWVTEEVGEILYTELE